MNEFIVSIAKKAANREVATLADFYKLGQMVNTGELDYDTARDDLVAAFKARKMSGATAKVYLSQGFGIAQVLPTMEDVKVYADANCKGSRSLKRIYDSLKADAKGDDEGDDEGDEAEVATPTALIDVILANLAHLTDRDEIALVRDAAIAML